MSNEKCIRIAVSGRSWLAREVLTRLAAHGFECSLLTEEGDTMAGERAQNLGIPTTKKSIRLPVLASDFPWKPDLIVSAQSFRILPDWLLQWARLGGLGYHPSLLPSYKGRHAIQDALSDGARFTGGSVYWLTGSIDDGPVAVANGRRLQDNVQVLPYEAPFSLWKRALAPLGADLLTGAVIAVENDHRRGKGRC